MKYKIYISKIKYVSLITVLISLPKKSSTSENQSKSAFMLCQSFQFIIHNSELIIDLLTSSAVLT
jgi:hypothetical protein